MGRRKNPHPKRAENARTVLKGEEFREKEEVKEPVVVCLQIPDDDDDDDDEMDEQIREEEPTFRKGSKRKRTQHECDVCEKVFRYPSLLANTCVLTRTRARMSVMFAIKLFVNLLLWKSTCVCTRTRNRTNVMCVRSVLLELIVCKATCVYTRTRNRMSVRFARGAFVNLVL